MHRPLIMLISDRTEEPYVTLSMSLLQSRADVRLNIFVHYSIRRAHETY